MIVLAMKAGGIAKNQCAKLCNIDKKHITNNIYPEESPVEPYSKNKHHEYISWFKAISIDGKVFDISRWFEVQIVRKKLDLEFKPLLIAIDAAFRQLGLGKTDNVPPTSTSSKTGKPI